MALQSIGGNVYLPSDIPLAISTVPGFTTTVVDADAEGYGIVFEAPATGTITGFGAPTGTLTAGDANTAFALRNVDTSATPGVPGGTTHASGTVNVNASNTWFNVAGLSYAATQGELLSATIVRPTSGSLNTQFRLFNDEAGGNQLQLPYAVINVGAGWTNFTTGTPCFAINYGGTYYTIRGSWPMSAITTTAFSNTSSPDVIGNIWIPRLKCRVTGVWTWLDLDSSCQIKFYDTDGVTVLAQATLGANYRNSSGAGAFLIPFDDSLGPTSITPTVGATYRIGIEPSSGTNIACYDFTIDSAAIMDSFGFGQNMYYTQAKDPTGTGDWTNTVTRRTFLGVIVDQLDDGIAAATESYTNRGLLVIPSKR